MHHVVVSGLGPAGATLLYELASRGYSVLGIDRERFPRYKSCGGCISTKIDTLKGLDLKPLIETPVYGATFSYRQDRYVDIFSDEPVAYNVKRDLFDAYLVERAKKAGATVIEGCKVEDFLEEKDHIRVVCEGGKSFSARFFVCADGAGSLVARKHFSLNPKEFGISYTMEIPVDEAETEKMLGTLYIDFGEVPFGYGWIFPKKGLLSVGVAGESKKCKGRLRQDFEKFLQNHKILAGRALKEKVHGWMLPIYHSDGHPVIKGRALAVGDAAHLVDPFLGEGIYYAMASAQAAAESIIEAIEENTTGFESYREYLKREFYPEFRALSKLAGLVYTHPRLWYRMVEKEPQIMLRYYDVIRGRRRADEFYRWVLSKVIKKPWKVLRRWLEDKFLRTG